MPRELWKTLLAQALLGTARNSMEAPPAGGPLGEVLTRLEAGDPEGRLLKTAGVLSLYHQAGWEPPQDTAALPDPAPEDERACCSAGAAQHLGAILSGRFTEVLPEWLEAASTARVRAPESLLPALLDEGSKGRWSGERHRFLPVLGHRGSWLAHQNSDWSWATPAETATTDEEDQLWQTGGREARGLLLERVRAADPERGRRMLENTWREDPAADRAAFLARLQVGLQPEDEPFLESCLDDRSTEVRRAAAELLARLPGSAYCARMLARLEALITAERLQEGRNVSRLSLAVTLPQELDPGMKRDGLSPNPPGNSTVGRRGVWLSELLSAVPPSAWYDRWEASPAEIVAAAVRTEWRKALLDGWSVAAQRYRDAALAEALLRLGMDETPWGELLGLLAPETAEGIILEQLRKEHGLFGESEGANQVFHLLREHRRPWSALFTREILAALRRNAHLKTARSHWYLRSELKNFALYASPEVADEARQGWPEGDQNPWGNALESFLDLLHFRNEMLQELSR